MLVVTPLPPVESPTNPPVRSASSLPINNITIEGNSFFLPLWPVTADGDCVVHPEASGRSPTHSPSPLPGVPESVSWNFVERILYDLKHSDVAFYGGTPNIASHAEFFVRGATGDMAIVKNKGGEVQEFLLSGIFEIDRQDFFMGAEGGYMPANIFNRDFVNTKLSCNLTAVQRDSMFLSTRSDFTTIIANIKALEKLIQPKKGSTSVSCVRDTGSQPGIRLNHSLFNVSNFVYLYIITNSFLEER